jgi:hypothetical protein
MRLHGRLHPVAAAALAALLALGASSCETLSGSGQSGADFAQSRAELAASRSALNRAAMDGDLPAVATSLRGVGSQFDAIEKKNSSMNLMDRENLNIQIATGRRIITETSRWVSVNDADAVRSQVSELDPILVKIDALLDRAVKSSVPDPGTQ